MLKCPLVTFRFTNGLQRLIKQREGAEKNTVSTNIPHGKSITSLPIFSSKSQRSGLGFGFRSSMRTAAQYVGTGSTCF